MVSPSDFSKRPQNTSVKKIEYETIDFHALHEAERNHAKVEEKEHVFVYEDFTCQVCEASFVRVVENKLQVYCSPRCKSLARTERKKAEYEKSLLKVEIPQNEEHLAASYHAVTEKKFSPRITHEDTRTVTETQTKEDEFDVRCPHSSKKVYRTWEEAERFILEVHPLDNYIHPYTCRCGAIHIGH